MAEEIPSISSLLGMLPQRIRNRFNWIGGEYVRGIVEEEQTQLGIARELSSEQIRSIQVVVLIFSLQRFFSEGSRVARAAAASLEDRVFVE